MRILFEEQDLINAIAVEAAVEYHDGDFEGCNPELVTVKLEWDEHQSVHATVTRPFHHTIRMDTGRIFAAMAGFLLIHHNFNPDVLVHETTYFHDENRYEGISTVLS